MSRTRHTAPPRVYAERVGEFQVARVIERRPRPGDIHPVSKRLIECMLMVVPLEFVVGLRRIELRAREGRVGEPYAAYWPDERAIVVYSVPREWHYERLAESARRSMRRHGALVAQVDGGWRIHWGESARLDRWFTRVVVFHELGHHFDRQYQRRRGRTRGRRYSEAFADQAVSALFRAFRREVDRLKRARAADA